MNEDFIRKLDLILVFLKYGNLGLINIFLGK